MIEIHLYAFMSAIIGYVYSAIMTEPGHIFYPAWKFFDRTLNPYVFKPLMDCYKCVSGQIALWSGVFLIQNENYFMRVFTHAYFICLTIFISIILNKIYETIKGN